MTINSVTASEARIRFGRLLDRVAKGEEIVVTRHDKPVARLIPAGRPPTTGGTRGGRRPAGVAPGNFRAARTGPGAHHARDQVSDRRRTPVSAAFAVDAPAMSAWAPPSQTSSKRYWSGRPRRRIGGLHVDEATLLGARARYTGTHRSHGYMGPGGPHAQRTHTALARAIAAKLTCLRAAMGSGAENEPGQVTSPSGLPEHFRASNG